MSFAPIAHLKRSTHHGAAADLVFLKRLFNLLQHSQVANVDTDTLTGRAKGTQSVADVHVNLARIGLAGDDESRAETGLLGHKLIQLLDFLVVTLENLKERCLGTSGALDTTEAQVVASTLEVAQIHQQILDPQTSTLAHSHQLCGLSVSESQTRQVLVLPGELRQLIDDNGQLGNEDVETVAEQNEVGVVSAVARSRTPVDDTSRGRGDLTKSVDVGHDIVSPALLLLGGYLELVVLDRGMGLHLLDRLICNGKAELYNHDRVN